MDARVLDHYAEAAQLVVRPLGDADTQELNEMTTRLSQFTTMLVAEKNRLGRGTGAVHPRTESHINWLEKELKDLDQYLRETLLRSPAWRQKGDLLRSVPGVSEQVSVSLLAYLTELGAPDRKQIAALVWSSRPSTGTAELCEAGAPYGAAGRGSRRRFTRERW